MLCVCVRKLNTSKRTHAAARTHAPLTDTDTHTHTHTAHIRYDTLFSKLLPSVFRACGVCVCVVRLIGVYVRFVREVRV